jgi:hypothetical protein
MNEPTDEHDGPTDPESLFLIALWARLDAAVEAASCADAMSRLPEVLRLCEEAVEILKQGPDRNP